MPLSDSRIKQGFLRGDTDSNNIIVGWIEEVVRSRVWVRAIASEDVVAEVSLRLLENFRSGAFRHESTLKTYVQRVTRYTIIGMLRAQRRSEKYLKEVNTPSSHTDTPLKIYEDNEEVLLFNRVLSLLDEKCRGLWRMILYDELSYKEIGKKTGMSVGAIKQRIRRCKEAATTIISRLT